MTCPNDLEPWLDEQPAPLADVLRHIARSCVRIGRAAAHGAPAGEAGAAVGVQAPGGPHRTLKALADDCMGEALGRCPDVAAWSSEAQSAAVVSPDFGSRGAYLVVFNPLDGASNIEPNASTGTIFSVLPHLFRGTPASDAAFMQPGRRQVAAGYVIYGPATVLVLGTGRGVRRFTLDPGASGDDGCWRASREDVQVLVSTGEFAIDMANQRFWEKPVQRYVAECLAGQAGPRGRDFGMRWMASLTAEVHRILTRGGVFLDPRDNREPYRPGRLRLMHEAAPMAWLIEQGGGAASNGSSPLLDLVPDALHQRVPVILGSREEVERVVSYHADPSENVSWQLFRTRSLFVQPNA